MNSKTIAIVGVGPSIGMSLARKFGRGGYNVGLISRSKERLAGYVEELQKLGIDAVALPADVKNRSSLQQAIGGIEQHFGAIDVLEYSPLLDLYALVDVLSLDEEKAQEQIDFQLLGAITSVRAVLPQMIARGDGALLFTIGSSAYMPAPSHANGALGVTALKQYALMLHMALKPKDIYVGSLAIGYVPDPVKIADIYWQKVQERKGCETLYGDPRFLTIYEELVTRGYGRDYPPQLLKDLPEPKTEAERNLFLIALYHIKENIIGSKATERQGELPRLTALALRFGGVEKARYFGGNIDTVFPPIRVL
jgi:NAD(P)-dependent dehydrogenase (short-subunit alcohol dehydrogenase family)